MLPVGNGGARPIFRVSIRRLGHMVSPSGIRVSEGRSEYGWRPARGLPISGDRGGLLCGKSPGKTDVRNADELMPGLCAPAFAASVCF